MTKLLIMPLLKVNLDRLQIMLIRDVFDTGKIFNKNLILKIIWSKTLKYPCSKNLLGKTAFQNVYYFVR